MTFVKLCHKVFITCFSTLLFTPISVIATPEDAETSPPQVQKLETDWLELKPGFTGKLLGAHVDKIEKMDDGKMTRIQISMPTDKDGRKIEHVVVRGKRGNSEYDMTLNRKVEVIKDIEAGKTGVVVHIGDDKPFKLLINYIDYSDGKFDYQ